MCGYPKDLGADPLQESTAAVKSIRKSPLKQEVSRSIRSWIERGKMPIENATKLVHASLEKRQIFWPLPFPLSTCAGAKNVICNNIPDALFSFLSIALPHTATQKTPLTEKKKKR